LKFFTNATTCSFLASQGLHLVAHEAPDDRQQPREERVRGHRALRALAQSLRERPRHLELELLQPLLLAPRLQRHVVGRARPEERERPAPVRREPLHPHLVGDLQGIERHHRHPIPRDAEVGADLVGIALDSRKANLEVVALGGQRMHVMDPRRRSGGSRRRLERDQLERNPPQFSGGLLCFREILGALDPGDQRLAALAVSVDVPGERRVEARIVAVGLGRLLRLELRLETDVGAQEELLLRVLVDLRGGSPTRPLRGFFGLVPFFATHPSTGGFGSDTASHRTAGEL
jgi:hypothetical protein